MGAGRVAAAAAVARHPSLWPTAVRQALVLAAPGWWRRRPFLPLPSPDYLRFRLQTAYGGDGDRAPEPDDLVTYLRWCRALRVSRARRDRPPAGPKLPTRSGARACSVAAMSRALVLNATFEPLCVVSDRRAVVLVLGETAEMLHASEALMHSAHLVIAVPSVVRLRRFVRVPYRWNTPLNRRSVFARDGHRCQYCDGPAESIDHVVPRSRGGGHSWDNVVAACRPCNVRKRDRLLEETSDAAAAPARARLGARAGSPSRVGAVPDTWTPYLQIAA